MRLPSAQAIWLPPLCAMLVATAGCSLVGSTLVSSGSRRADLPLGAAQPKPPPRTIQVEVLFVRHADDDPVLRHAIWDHVDEQAIDGDRRRALNANGIRAGVITGQPPPEVAERLAAATSDTPPGDVAGIDPVRSRRLLQLLPGRRSELVTATGLPQLVVLEHCGGDVRGGTFHDATPQLVLEASPAPDGRVRLEVVPEIRHGPVERTWEGEDGMFRLEAGQRRHRMDHLGIDVTVPPGGMLIVGGAGDPSATVGDGLLGDSSGSQASRRLVVIRAVARSVDPAFAATERESISDDE